MLQTLGVGWVTVKGSESGDPARHLGHSWIGTGSLTVTGITRMLLVVQHRCAVDVERGPAVADILDLELGELDPDVHAAIAAELHRQQSTLEMIASENFAPSAVMEAQGSVLTNKYAEGYPGRRYYGGCEDEDADEQLGVARGKETINARDTEVPTTTR